jgi:microcystin-dependent protein
MSNSAMSANLSLVGRFIPPGTIFPFAGSSAPDTWLICDGSAISRTTYATLFNLIGTTYDTQYNPVTGSNWSAPAGTDFRIPDYRGMFHRGTGTPNGLDTVTIGNHQLEKTAKNGLALSDPGHIHYPLNGYWAVNTNGGYTWEGDTGQRNEYPATAYGPTNLSLGNGDNETRPLGRGVNFIIKVG